MMIKRIAPGSWDFGCSAVEQVKVASSGIRGTDLQALVKRAGHQFADKMRDIKLAPGEVPIHLIALGAYERYGCNRNGDAFKQAACEKYHPTFVKHARFYRNHQNKDTAKSYGIIKMSAYNEKMHRIELLVALNGTKEAADRNGGLVADKELEKLARGADDWGVSMACRVPFDVCSGCGNNARNRSEYCTEQTCKYGGCMNNLTKVADDGHVLHVDNPTPTWFDISDVHRPADRIAWVMGEMRKSAGAITIGGAQMAEESGMILPPHLRFEEADIRTARLIKLAYDMMDVERDLEAGRVSRTFDDLAIAQQPSIAAVQAGFGQAWNALAHEKIALNVRNWMALVPSTDHGVLTKQASHSAVGAALPGVFSRLVADGDNLEKYLSDRTCDPSQAVASEPVRVWARKHASAMSLAKSHLDRRRVSAIVTAEGAPTLPNMHTKQASHDPQAEHWARRYAVYQLHLLDEWQRDPQLPQLKELLVRQNYLS